MSRVIIEREFNYHSGEIDYNIWLDDKNIGKLISDIEIDRSDKIIKHGYNKYRIERNQDYFKKRSINYKNQAA